MIVKKLISAAALSGLAFPALADCFRTEWGVSYLNGETESEYSIPEYTPPTDLGSPGLPPSPGTGTGTGTTPTPGITVPETSPGFDDTVDYDGFVVSGEVFLAPVSCDSGPLKEAAFLSQVSSIGGAYGQIEDDGDVETDILNAFARIVANSWVVEGELVRNDIDAEFADSEVDYVRIAGGRYLADATQLLFSYENTDFDIAEADRYAVDIKHVAQLENGMSYTVDALVGFVQTDTIFGQDDDGFDLALMGDWYFNNQFSVGAEIEFADRDSVGSLVNYTLNATYFFTEKILVSATYQDFDDDALSILGDQFVVEFKYRR
ncbi:MAG: hypothetical protein AAF648_14750 [Pseudomonadota bacterium]